MVKLREFRGFIAGKRQPAQQKLAKPGNTEASGLSATKIQPHDKLCKNIDITEPLRKGRADGRKALAGRRDGAS